MPHSKERTGVQHLVCDTIPKPLPIFSHATIHNGTVYVSCLQGFLPGSLEFPSDAPEDQARQVLRNLKVVLDQAGSSMDHVLKINIFMTDMKHFDKINEAVNEAFPDNPPARSSLAILELPKNAKVAVDAVAAVKDIGPRFATGRGQLAR